MTRRHLRGMFPLLSLLLVTDGRPVQAQVGQELWWMADLYSGPIRDPISAALKEESACSEGPSPQVYAFLTRGSTRGMNCSVEEADAKSSASVVVLVKCELGSGTLKALFAPDKASCDAAYGHHLDSKLGPREWWKVQLTVEKISPQPYAEGPVRTAGECQRTEKAPTYDYVRSLGKGCLMGIDADAQAAFVECPDWRNGAMATQYAFTLSEERCEAVRRLPTLMIRKLFS
jgi:hypothetical protein